MRDSDLATFMFPNTVVDGPTKNARDVREMDGNNCVVSFDSLASSGWIIWTDKQSAAPGAVYFPPIEEVDDDFFREKSFFETLTHEELRDYRNQYVAIHEQRIADHDHDLYTLTNRFFSDRGHVPVYISFIGTKPQHFIPGPIL